jgi:hypothetical protein
LFSDTSALTDSTIKRQTQRGAIPPLRIVEDFMLSLTSPNNGLSQTVLLTCLLLFIEGFDSDGRITLTVVGVPGREDTVELKYQLLNPAPNFMEVVEEARAVVLAGGTMSPVCNLLQSSSRNIYIYMSVRSDVRCYQPAVFTPSIGENYIFFMWTYHPGRKSANFSC